MTEPDHPAWVDAVRRQMTALGVSQRLLAELLGVKQTTVSGWLNEGVEPRPPVVFAVEAGLEVAPGTLSRLLGYLPTSIESDCTVELALNRDPDLDDGQRQVVLDVYRAVTR